MSHFKKAFTVMMMLTLSLQSNGQPKLPKRDGLNKKALCEYLASGVRDYAESYDELKICVSSCLKGQFQTQGNVIMFQGKLMGPDSHIEQCKVVIENGQFSNGQCLE